MRFKQTKPVHVKKKEGDEDSDNHINRGASLLPSNTGPAWNGLDCVDGDMDIEKLNHQSSAAETTLKPQNGHGTVMDMRPVLELYNNQERGASNALLQERLNDPPTPVTSENDVIVHGRRPVFSEPEETIIATKMNEWREQGLKYTRLDVVKMASEYAVLLGKRPQARPLTVKWFRSFLTRHPECSIRRSRRATCEPPEKQYFNQLDTVLTANNLKKSPHCIFSLVELPLPMLKHEEVLVTEDVAMNISSRAAPKSLCKLGFIGNVPSSILICGSAAGQALPPFLIFTGKMMDKSLLAGLTPGAGGMTCPSGRATSEVLVSFLKDHFLSQAPGRAGDTLVLLLDASLECSISQAVADIGSAFKVVFVTAQATLNPELRPLVVGCCDTFQRELSHKLQKPLYTSESTQLSSASICEFLCRLYHHNMTAENLHSTFRKAGIFPFNPSIRR